MKLVKTIKSLYNLQKAYDQMPESLYYTAFDDDLYEALETLKKAVQEWRNEGDKETRRNRRKQIDTVCRILGTNRQYIYR